MSQVQTYSQPALWDPDNEQVAFRSAKQIVSSGVEVTSLKLATAGAGPATVFLYDNGNAQANPTDLVWVLDAPAGGPDFNSFPNPLVFKKGVYAVLAQGGGLRPIVTIAILPAGV